MKKIEDFDFSKVIAKVSKLQEEDGSFRIDPDQSPAAANAGFAFEVIGAVIRRFPELEKKNSADIRSVIDRIEALLELGFKDESIDFSDATHNNLVGSTLVLAGVVDLASSLEEKLDISENHLITFTSFLIANKYVQDIENIYFLLDGLVAASDNPINVPLILSLVEAKPQKLTVKVTTVFDKPVPAKVVVTEAKGPGGVVFKSGALSKKGETYFLENAENHWKDSKSGVYLLSFTVTPIGEDERYKEAVIHRSVKLTTQISSVEIDVSVSESAKASSSDKNFKASHPGHLNGKVTVDADRFVHIKLTLSFSKAEFQPQQVFLQLTKEKNQAAIFVLQSAGKDSFFTKLNLGSAEFQESVFGSGDYQVSIIIGDSLLVNSLVWPIGQFSIDVSSTQKQNATDPFLPAPEIDHIFQKPDDRPSASVALIFSGLVLAPLFVIFLGLTTTGIRYDVPANGTEFISGFLFQVCLALILLLYVFYWLQLNIFQALAGLGVLSIPTLFFGNQALKLRHERFQKGN